jgi:eukaryotic-like serine/threonine-protein kinase
MRESPPAHLTALLAKLGLAERDVERVEPTVHRIAGDLPRFESVWIDALRQTRILTQFQAAEFHAGRGDQLRLARYVLCQSVQECGYMTIYRAEEVRSREPVRLAVFACPDDARDLLRQVDSLMAQGKALPRLTGIIEAAGIDGSQAWIASPWVNGTPLADLVLQHNRFPADVVLEIARGMLAELAAMESVGVIHGDIRMHNVLVDRAGQVRLPHPGLRGLIRPHEGISHLDLTPDTCSGLAPERVTEGRPPSRASDLFACGCVWWHLLCGRPPLGGGDAPARLRAAQAAAVDDLHQWAIGVPDELVAAVNGCLRKDPRQRPQSMAELAEQLGPLRNRGRQSIARCLAAHSGLRAPWLAERNRRGNSTSSHRLTTATIVLLALLAVAWPVWVARNRPRASLEVARHDPPMTARTSAAQAASSNQEPRRADDSQGIVDSAVTPAGYVDGIGLADSVKARGDGRTASGGGNQAFGKREETCLPIDRATPARLLQLKPGQRVYAKGGRARVVVPRPGLAVQVEGVRFEGIDFVAETDASPESGRNSPALICLAASRCEFVGCSFQSAPGTAVFATAVVWRNAGTERELALLPSGRISMKNCVFRRVAAGVELRFHGAIGIEMVNTLHLGPGPLLRLAHVPEAEEPLHVALAQLTLRDADVLIDCRCPGSGRRCGELAVEASGCILAPRPQAALLLLSPQAFDVGLTREVRWTGRGSLLAGPAAFARLHRDDGADPTIDDTTISISGLVRGEVEFAGQSSGNPLSSGIVNCQAPLQDTDSAGAAVKDLPADLVPVR